MSRAGRAALVALAMVTAVAPTRAQDPGLADALDSLAALWLRGDATRIAAQSALRGIELELHGESMGRVSGRKAVATLRHLFAEHETVAVRTVRTAAVTGAEDAAFAELSWESRVRGSAVPERSTVFVALVREGRSWRVSQIRVRR